MNSHMAIKISLVFITSFMVLDFSQARAQELTSRSLLKMRGDQAAKQARDAMDRGREEDADTWRMWAVEYWIGAENPAIQRLSPHQFASAMAEEMQSRAIAMINEGANKAADLYQASSNSWRKTARQIANGEKIAVDLPNEMLTRIPGLKGTPYERLAGGGPLQPDVKGAMPERCFSCFGRGQKDCIACNGMGRNDLSKFTNPFTETEAQRLDRLEREKCKQCGATGKVRCLTCLGTGKIR